MVLTLILTLTLTLILTLTLTLKGHECGLCPPGVADALDNPLEATYEYMSTVRVRVRVRALAATYEYPLIIINSASN